MSAGCIKTPIKQIGKYVQANNNCNCYLNTHSEIPNSLNLIK